MGWCMRGWYKSGQVEGWPGSRVGRCQAVGLMCRHFLGRFIPGMRTEDWILIRFSSASRRWLWVLNIFSEKQ